MMRKAVCALAPLLLGLSGCGAAANPGAVSQPADDGEKFALGRAISPLLVALGYPLQRTLTGVELRGDCRIALGIVNSSATNAAVTPGQANPCVYFGLLVTEGALQTLAPGDMTALLAHELAHVHLGHLAGSGKPHPATVELTSVADERAVVLRSFTDAPLILPTSPDALQAADETEADRLASRILSRLEGGEACLRLAERLERLARDAGDGASSWLSTHPPLIRRARAVRALCEGERLPAVAGGRGAR